MNTLHHQPDTPATLQDSTNPASENTFMEIMRFALLALIIVLPIRWFIAQPYIVSGASMEETFHNNEYLIVDQVTYRFEEPERGDVIVFHYPVNPKQSFIKRVIGLPGDTVSIEGRVVIIENENYPDGIALNEPYINKMDKEVFLNQTLGDGEYFVMGDNRDHSSDSRTWGTVSEDEIVGRVLLRLFPFSTASIMPGDYAADEALVAASNN